MVPVFVVGRDLHLHYPLESLPSLLCSETDNISRHTKMRFITSEQGPPGVLRLRPVTSYGGERNNNDEAMPRGGRLVIIRLFVTITIMLSRSKIVVFLLALHDTTICYFRPAQSVPLDFSSYFNPGFKNQDPEKIDHITHVLCLIGRKRNKGGQQY